MSVNPVVRLDLNSDVVALTAALIDTASESRHEELLADLVETALLRHEHLEVLRDGNTIVARTSRGAAERVVIAGHLDTVPAAGNVPHRLAGNLLYGLGSCDMKGGVAIALLLAAQVCDPTRDVTYLFYDCEEIDSKYNGLGRLAKTHPDWLQADFAILMEPSNASVEVGCQGTIKVMVRTSGTRAHSARSWMGENAIHKVGEVLSRLNAYEPQRVVIDGLEYREGLNAVRVSGGVAGNVIPDEAWVMVNYRYAPSRSAPDAEQHVREVFAGFELDVVDNVPGAMPGLDHPAAASFIEAVGATPMPKFGWTDVALFSSLGIPAINFGPGDPSLAHHKDEHVPIEQLESVKLALHAWLTAPPSH